MAENFDDLSEPEKQARLLSKALPYMQKYENQRWS